MDCGPTCLRMIAKHYGKSFSREYLSERAHITREGVSMAGIAEAAESIGLRSMALDCNFTMLQEDVPLPCIAYWRQRHFVVVHKIEKEQVHVADPAFGLIVYSKADFLKAWLPVTSNPDDPGSEGFLLLLEPSNEFHEKETGEAPPIRRGIPFLFSYLRPYRRYLFQIIIGLVVGSIIQLIFPFLTQAMVDIGVNHRNIGFIYLILLAQLVLFISQTSVDFIRSWLLLHITSRVNVTLISDFLLKLMRLPISFFDSKNVGDLLQRIQDNNRIQTFLSTATLNILFSFINLIIFGIVLVYYSLPIFLIFITAATLYFFWVKLFLKKRAILDYKRFDQAAGNQSSIIQLINGMQEIKLSGSERRRRWEWELIQVKLFKLSVKGLSLAQTQDIGGHFLMQTMNILISFIAAKSVIDGHITLGMMLSVQYIVGQLNLPVNNFVSFMQSYQDARISLERLNEIHLKESEDAREAELLAEINGSKSLKLANVSFRYGGQTAPYVLNNLSFEIPENKVTAIVGASGSGKTTLLKLLLKFYEPSSGEILVNRNSLNSFNNTFWRKKCGVVMQDGFLFADTIARNITESDAEGSMSKERLAQAVNIANLQEFVENLPGGYKTRIGASGINISGGQKQRVLIARAVYKNPDYLFFDEATSALDANNEKIIMENLEQFYAGKTVVVVAHRLSTVKNADQIIVLDKGSIIETGTHQSLTQQKGAYYHLVKNQLELGQ